MPSQSWGVQPDIVVSLTADEVQAIQESRRALDLVGGESFDGAKQADGALPMEPSPSPSSEILRDRQLLAALEILAHGD